MKKGARAALAAGLFAVSGSALAAEIGHYEMCSGAGSAEQAPVITAAGHTPVHIEVPDAASLSGLAALFVTNCNNGGFGTEYVANLGAIEGAVNSGMALIIHDRAVSGANAILPGGSEVAPVRNFDDDINIDFPVDSPILTGVGGTLTNSSLDNGSSSSHGYVAVDSLPPGAIVLATRTSTAEAVTFSYAHGAGRVVYSTIPLDYYLDDTDQPGLNMRTVYAPNLVAWAAGPVFTSCAAEGFTGAKLYQCRQICEVDQNPYHLLKLVRLYRMVFREDPPCAD